MRGATIKTVARKVTLGPPSSAPMSSFRAMNVETVPSYWVRIFLSGPIEQAMQTIRGECLKEGLCVTIEPTRFIYTGGEEQGYVVGLVNYPRFPSESAALVKRARALMHKLLADTFQHSAMFMTPETTEWVTLRVDQLPMNIAKPITHDQKIAAIKSLQAALTLALDAGLFFSEFLKYSMPEAIDEFCDATNAVEKSLIFDRASRE